MILATNGESKWAKDLAYECGVKVSEIAVKDRFPPSSGENVAAPWPSASENIVGGKPSAEAFVSYSGVSTELTPEAIGMGGVRVLQAAVTSYQSKSSVSGSKIGLISSVQMLNNARVTVTGSVRQFDDSLQGSNDLFNIRLSSWTFADASILRVVSWGHRKHDGSSAEKQVKHARHLESNLPRSHFPDPEWGPDAKLYRIRDEIDYKIAIEELGFEGKWKPFVTNDLQLEFAMLDPYQRRTLTHLGNGQYATTFMLPDQYGTFAFRLVYNRPGLSRLRILDSVNVRPFRHDEYERFIPAAYPYYAAVAVVMVGFLVFSIAFASVRRVHTKTE